MIRSIISWFAIASGVGHEINQNMLDTSDDEFGAWVIAKLIIKGITWIASMALWVCFMIGYFLAMSLLRRMEFDADAYEFAWRGSETFERTSKKMPSLIGGEQVWFSALLSQAQCSLGFPKTCRRSSLSQPAMLPPELKKRLKKLSRKENRSVRHAPSDKDRIAAARKADCPVSFMSICPRRSYSVILTNSASTPVMTTIAS